MIWQVKFKSKSRRIWLWLARSQGHCCLHSIHQQWQWSFLMLFWVRNMCQLSQETLLVRLLALVFLTSQFEEIPCQQRQQLFHRYWLHRLLLCTWVDWLPTQFRLYSTSYLHWLLHYHILVAWKCTRIYSSHYWHLCYRSRFREKRCCSVSHLWLWSNHIAPRTDYWSVPYLVCKGCRGLQR